MKITIKLDDLGVGFGIGVSVSHYEAQNCVLGLPLCALS